MGNAWRMFWASFASIFSAIHHTAATVEVAAEQAHKEAISWGEVLDLDRGDRVLRKKAEVEAFIKANKAASAKK